MRTNKQDYDKLWNIPEEIEGIDEQNASAPPAASGMILPFVKSLQWICGYLHTSVGLDESSPQLHTKLHTLMFGRSLPNKAQQRELPSMVEPCFPICSPKSSPSATCKPPLAALCLCLSLSLSLSLSLEASTCLGPKEDCMHT